MLGESKESLALIAAALRVTCGSRLSRGVNRRRTVPDSPFRDWPECVDERSPSWLPSPSRPSDEGGR